MRIKNKNLVVFILAFLFVAAGVGRPFLAKMFMTSKQLVSEVLKKDPDAISNFTASVDSDSSASVRYHDTLMNINSFKERVLNTKSIQKDEDTIVVADGGTLVAKQDKMSDESLQESVTAIKALYENAVENGAEFLYVAAPKKGYGFSFPSNIEDFTTDNHIRYVSKLMASDIPTLDLASNLQSQGLLTQKSFYNTDHHWTAETGLLATNEICKELNKRYSFSYEKAYLNINNYESTVYKDWFLGSYGKKVGAYLLPSGPDDFNLITPKFKTSLIEKQPNKNETRMGSFEETALYKENIAKKDWYGKNPYATYSGGDFRLQIFENSLAENDKKILVIRDSYACVVTPFLALQAKELHVVDVRNYSYYVGDKLNAYDYIEEVKPDYVIVLYVGAVTDESSGKLDFD